MNRWKRQLHERSANFIKLTDLNTPEPYNCIEDKQTLQQIIGGESYHNKQIEILHLKIYLLQSHRTLSKQTLQQ